MTAKEKADELIDKMYYIGRYDDKEDYNPAMAWERAKQCALMAVEEILNARPLDPKWVGMIVVQHTNIGMKHKKRKHLNFGIMSSRSCSLCKVAYNGSRLCVCLPLAQSFNLPQMLMGQIAQNRCYKLAADY